MAEHSVQHSMSQSSVSVITPRNSRSSISNTFPISQTSLISQTRRTSENHTEVKPTVTSTSPQTPVSSIPSFRSLRSLLPFGPAKVSNPPPDLVQSPKPSFVTVNFGSLRRITNDRKNSATYSRPDEQDQPPIIAIARASETFEEEMMARKRSRDLARSQSDSNVSSRLSAEHYVLPALSPGPPLGADLSTIIEADNSGISKHIPFLDDITHPDADSSSRSLHFNPDQNERSRQPSPDSREASVFDLSTSKLTAEVLDALKVKDSTTATEWLKGVNGVVVEEGHDESLHHNSLSRSPHAEDDEGVFDFGALDPDLAELLSPNKINGKSSGSKPVPSRLPSRTHSRKPSHPLPPPSLGPPNGDLISPQTSPRLSSIVPPSSPTRVIAQSSPTRRTVSLSRVNQVQSAASSLPRLMRSVSNAPASTNPPSEGSSTPTSIRAPTATKKRYQPPSPLSSQAHSSQASPVSSRGSSELPSRRLPASRLATPIRHVSSYIPGNSRLADAPIIHPPPNREKSLANSLLSSRSASDPMRQSHSRPSLELGGTLEVNKRRRAHLFYNRRRSQSVEDARLSPTSAPISSRTSPTRPSSSQSNGPPAMEWLGPRTVKAFAAAGLLDGDKDGPNVRMSGAGRYASLRASTERDDRFVPSRAAFSEVASTSSWGRSGSVSRGMTPSESGVTWAGSPTFSAPRTTFSGGSTAPTSISASSSAQQATIQLMKEKHDLETEALLSALSDSQRTTKTLREENLQLRDRIRELEDELDEMRTQIHRLSSGVLPSRPPPSAFPKSAHDRVVLPSPLIVPRRPLMQRSHSHLDVNNASISSVDLSTRPREESPSREDSLLHPRRRRASTSSSVFPNLPHNMSMLMLEETMHDRDPLSTSSVSPQLSTHGLPARSSGGYVSRGEHTNQSSMSSSAKLSPTATSFCLTEVPGSPTSLQLRPEHEMHLGDMASLSLYAMSDEEL